MEITLRHRTASGDAFGACWEFDPSRRLLIARVRLSDVAAPVDFEITLRGDRWSGGGFLVSRVSEECWRVERGRYDPRLPPLTLVLTCAPAAVNLELAALP